ncbi:MULTISPECIES: type III secretion system needle filament subunit SctF [Photorhabdus]|uniref:Type III export protein PscF n=1 Tax=Photorhabdus namnaonensis TaxID=1851568 RepID=A0A1B8YMF7_9GAMM|nr:MULTISPECIES: type III secretion system needle filament subunit SctF [Photorhabdus]MCC8457767.1 type III secretion system needle filament subunit SctF [Photorhabdus aegyptia]OCA56293.1 Type III export protein PscF [Photorhabdus namnaonensis]
MAKTFTAAAAPNANVLDRVAEQLTTQANTAETDVSAAITELGKGADNPALLADLQHKINKWSVIYNINSTVTRSMKDLMQSILQKI